MIGYAHPAGWPGRTGRWARHLEDLLVRAEHSGSVAGDAALDEGLPVLGYKISYVNDDGTETVLVENTRSMATQYMQTGLDAMTTRTYRVRAITLGGVGSNYAKPRQRRTRGRFRERLRSPSVRSPNLKSI